FLLGSARAADVRADVSQTDFYETADLVGWNDDLDQIVGLVARATTVGLGTTNGYLFVYNPQESPTGVHGRLEIDRIDGEVPTGLAFQSISFDPAHTYRMALTGVGSSFTGGVFDLTSGTTLVATLQATSNTYGSGNPGLVVADASENGDGAADGTFDNFTADVAPVPEPGAVTLAAVGALIAAIARQVGDARQAN